MVHMNYGIFGIKSKQSSWTRTISRYMNGQLTRKLVNLPYIENKYHKKVNQASLRCLIT